LRQYNRARDNIGFILLTERHDRGNKATAVQGAGPADVETGTEFAIDIDAPVKIDAQLV